MAIIEAIAASPLSEQKQLKRELLDLGGSAKVEAIEANTDGIFAAGNDRFEATGTAYVMLGGRKTSASSTDSFPVHVSGIVGADNTVKIESLTIDTSSFFSYER